MQTCRDISSRSTPACGVLLALVLGCVTATAAAHPGQSIDLKIRIDQQAVTERMLISADLALDLLPLYTYDLEYSAEDEVFHFVDEPTRQRVFDAFEAAFAEKNTVRVDGVPVKPIVERVQFVPAISPWSDVDPKTLPPDVEIDVEFPTKGRPRQVSLVWGMFPVDMMRATYGLDAKLSVMAQLDAFDENKMLVFTEQEPEIVWHAPGKSVTERVTPAVIASKPKTIPVPVASLGVAGFWIICLLFARFSGRWSRWRKPLLTGSVLPLLVALALYNVGVVSVVAPGAPSIELPDTTQAESIFTTLQRNVYRAFDYKSESDVYDVLAQSVDGELLDRIYNEVYQSLIMRDQGGAVARVTEVDVQDAELLSAGALPDSDRPAFRVRGDWQVKGAVYHWGHVHTRTNRYRAEYTIAQAADRWKIVGVANVEEERIRDEEIYPDQMTADAADTPNATPVDTDDVNQPVDPNEEPL